MKHRISELMDGELDERSAGGMIDALRRDGEAIEAWRIYHLISDAMRDTRPLSDGFTARFGERLAAEPTILSPSSLPGGPRQRFALAAAASLAAVALVGWLAFAPQQEPVPQMAQAKPPMMMTLPASANDYLLAHQGFSPRMSFQGMAPYVRTVSEQSDETRK